MNRHNGAISTFSGNSGVRLTRGRNKARKEIAVRLAMLIRLCLAKDNAWKSFENFAMDSPVNHRMQQASAERSAMTPPGAPSHLMITAWPHSIQSLPKFTPELPQAHLYVYMKTQLFLDSPIEGDTKKI